MSDDEPGDDRCGACALPLPPEESPALRGWLRATVSRQTARGTPLDPTLLLACPAHSLCHVPRQLTVEVKPARPVAAAPRAFAPEYRHCRGCRKPRSEPAPGWATVRASRVDRGELTFELCPDCSVEVR